MACNRRCNTIRIVYSFIFLLLLAVVGVCVCLVVIRFLFLFWLLAFLFSPFFYSLYKCVCTIGGSSSTKVCTVYSILQSSVEQIHNKSGWQEKNKKTCIAKERARATWCDWMVLVWVRCVPWIGMKIWSCLLNLLIFFIFLPLFIDWKLFRVFLIASGTFDFSLCYIFIPF